MSAGTGQIPDAASPGAPSQASAQTLAAAPGAAGRNYPQMPVQVNHVEPAPRRVRGFLGNELIFDTTNARYVWEIPYYPQYYIPLADIDARFLVDENAEQSTRRGTARRHGLSAGGLERRSTARVYGRDAFDGGGGH